MDPDLRRRAEDFAFRGRYPFSTTNNRQEEQRGQAARDGDSVRQTSNNTTSQTSGIDLSGLGELFRRIGSGNVTSRVDTAATQASSNTEMDAEERRRLGREYLARRNQEMMDRKMKKDFKREDTTCAKENKDESVKDSFAESMTRHESAVQAGSCFANPFDDEHQIIMKDEEKQKECTTPREPISEYTVSNESLLDMSYDEQIAKALDNSLSDNQHNINNEDDDLKKAIFASLKDTSHSSSRFDGDELYTLTPKTTGSQSVKNDLTLKVSTDVEPDSYSSAGLTPTTSTTDRDVDEYRSVKSTTSKTGESLVFVDEEGIDSLSEDENGILTPKSWSEIGSEVGSEVGDGEHLDKEFIRA